MAGMLPGVECARRRRLRQGGSSSGAAEAPCGTRRPSFCLYAGGHGRTHLGSSAVASSKERSGVCKEMMMARAWALDSNAREAKERLDQKLRGQRESAVKRHQMSTGTVRPLTAAKPPHATSTDASSNNLQHSATAAEPGATPRELQREVFSFSKPASGGGAAARRRRFSWRRLGRCSTPSSEAEAPWECAVCLEELRAGDVVAHLPCAHRFHWSCAVPWVRAASRCPVCRAQVHLAPSSPS